MSQSFNPSPKKISKKTLSTFLRTNCDKALYLWLHESPEERGLPKPVKRPEFGVLSTQGREFEIDRYEMLIRLFGPMVQFQKTKNKFINIDLKAKLIELHDVPIIIIEGKFSIGDTLDQILANIGLSPEEINLIPNIADFIPDILVVRQPIEGDMEVLTSGARQSISLDGEQRLAIDIFDVKHTSEANPSYCSELALYAVMMSNWLQSIPDLKSRYFITTQARLWTRFKQNDSQLTELEERGEEDITALLQALVADSEDAHLEYYLAAVRRFFQNVARVVKIGDASSTGWEDLDWHVNAACGGCDWLGDKRHLGSTDKRVVDANPDHYCMPRAYRTGHLSLVPGISKGAKKVLQENAIEDITALCEAHGSPSFQQHTLLKKEARTLPLRSRAILDNNISWDTDVAIASLAKSANILLYVSVNFDSSAGLLTGLSITGTATSFAPGQAPTRFRDEAYIVDQKTLDAEWVALEGFLTNIADCLAQADQLTTNPTGQIHFWEERQFKELCNAMGRHLTRVLALGDRRPKALAWLFAPEELVSTSDVYENNTLVFIADIVRRLVFTSSAHAITLFGTAETYNDGYASIERDSYFREYLNDGIPRERIYEIWSNESQVKRGTRLIPRTNIIVDYSNTLKKQVKTLASICNKLRSDYKEQFRASKPKIANSVPGGAQRVAFDSKLWIWWDDLDFHAAQQDNRRRLSLDGERLEATYEAILLTNGVRIRQGVFRYDVASTSTEAKFKEDSRLTLGKIGRPGMPLERVRNLLDTDSPPYSGNQDSLNYPNWSALDVKLLNFDRIQRVAEIQLMPREPALADYIVSNTKNIDLLNDVFLLETANPSAFNWSETSKKILRAIGHPTIAVPDPNAADAMGITSRQRRGGNDNITPAARVLWEPHRLEQEIRIEPERSQAIAAFAEVQFGLNPSQAHAVQHGAERGLTVIWGPPGTGKTNTLAALICGLTHDARENQQPLKILVVGPTYKAVEEVMGRTARFASENPDINMTMFMMYTGDRTLGTVPPQLAPHVQYYQGRFKNNDGVRSQCLAEIRQGNNVVIVGSAIRQARRFAQDIGGSDLSPVFDVVIIDESSQVPVSQSLSALACLKDDSRLIIAGDHLQMQPIAALDPPANAAYLVGSIQTYLRERKFAETVPRCVLEENYRSSTQLVDFAKRIGYPETLNAAYPETSLHLLKELPSQSDLPGDLPWSDEYPIVLDPKYSTVSILHEDIISSQGNEFEARIVAGLVWLLRQSVSDNLDGREPVEHQEPSPEEFWDKCVGIVTPHRAQRALVIKELQRLFPEDVNLIDGAVDTVERFQGGQRHTIIVTFGVADTDIVRGEEVFLMQLERTNVAVSRAMAKCIVIMPKALAEYIPEDKRALETAFALKDYVENFCNKSINTLFYDNHSQRSGQIRCCT